MSDREKILNSTTEVWNVMPREVVGHDCCIISARMLDWMLKEEGFHTHIVSCILIGECVENEIQIWCCEGEGESATPAHLAVMAWAPDEKIWYLADATLSQLSKSHSGRFPFIGPMVLPCEGWCSGGEPVMSGSFAGTFGGVADTGEDVTLHYMFKVDDEWWCKGSLDAEMPIEQLMSQILNVKKGILNGKVKV